MVDVKRERIIVIGDGVPMWRKCQEWQDAVREVRMKIIRGVAMYVPPKLGCIDDPGAELRGFLVHECNAWGVPIMLPTHAIWVCYGQPMSEEQIREMVLDGGHRPPFVFLDDGTLLMHTQDK